MKRGDYNRNIPPISDEEQAMLDVVTASDARLAEIQARVDAATPGPWCHYPEAGWIEIGAGPDEESSTDIIVNAVRPNGGWHNAPYDNDPESDAEFIAHARDDIPYLLALLSVARADGWNECHAHFGPHQSLCGCGGNPYRSQEQKPEWRCPNCGHDKWVGHRYGQAQDGHRRNAQCVRCGGVYELPEGAEE